MPFLSRLFLGCLTFVFVGLLFVMTSASQTFAQTPSSPPNPNSFAMPNVEANVPINQHTFTQSLFLELLIAFGCQLSGIDIASPYTPCLTINPLTNKLSYAPTSQDGQLQINGVIGMLNSGIGLMYTPTVSATDYTRYLASNFGLVKETLAAPQTGFEGLSPVRNLWIGMRDISYLFLVIAFVFIGLGVMLRVKLDPRTVMTIQNQIPRVIIAILLITFSYPIAGVMIDGMWVTTYTVINLISNTSNDPALAQEANNTLLASPFSFANRIFLVDRDDLVQNGLIDLSHNISNHIVDLELNVIAAGLGLDPEGACTVGPSTFFGAFDIGDCFINGLTGTFIRWFGSFLWSLTVFIILIITLFRIWLALLRAYAQILIYVIMAPLYIVINLLPKRPLGFERWIRVFFANLAVFPATVAMILLSFVLTEGFRESNPQTIVPPVVKDVNAANPQATGNYDYFLPPLIGSPNTANFGVIVGFAVLLLTPSVQDMLRRRLGVEPIKEFGEAKQTFNAGRQATAAPAKQGWKHLNQRDQYGNAVGPIAGYTDRFTNAIGKKAQNLPIAGKFVGEHQDKKEYMRSHYGSLAGYQKGWQHKADFDIDQREAYGKGRASAEAFDKAWKKKDGSWDLERYGKTLKDKGQTSAPPVATAPGDIAEQEKLTREPVRQPQPQAEPASSTTQQDATIQAAVVNVQNAQIQVPGGQALNLNSPEVQTQTGEQLVNETTTGVAARPTDQPWYTKAVSSFLPGDHEGIRRFFSGLQPEQINQDSPLLQPPDEEPPTTA